MKTSKEVLMARTAKISPNSEAIIQELVARTGKTKIDIIDLALDSYRYQERMRLLNQQYERLRAEEKAWEQELKERKELEGTLMDGLEIRTWIMDLTRID